MIKDLKIFETQYENINLNQSFNPLKVMTIKEKLEKDKIDICKGIILDLTNELIKKKIEEEKKA